MPIQAIPIPADGEAPCRGFTLEVKVFVPKKGFRFHIIVDKTCVSNEPRWALLFELEKKIDGEFVQIVFVKYKPKPDDAIAAIGIEKMLETEVTQKQLKIAKDEIFPVALEMEGSSGPTPAQKRLLEESSRKFAVAEIG